MAEKLEGSCRCGRVRFAVDGAPLITMACHCTGCQRMTSSAFSLSSLYPDAGFAVTAGAPVIGGLHGATRQYFCPHYLSWMFTRPDGLSDLVNVHSTMFDDTRGAQPFAEAFTGERLPWAATGAAHSFEAFPPPELFPVLFAEFARATRAK